MKSIPVYGSVLSESMREFVEFKRMQGYEYRVGAYKLKLFDRFLKKSVCFDGILKDDVFAEYIASMHCKPISRVQQLSVVRQFSRYLHSLHPENTVLSMSMQPKYTHNLRFYYLSSEEIKDLMLATAELKPVNGIKVHCVRFLIGFLYCTGLRINEALNLNLENVNVQDAVITVRKGKFGKDRIVALSESMSNALKQYLDVRSRYASTGLTAPLMVGKYNARLTYWQAVSSFRKLCKITGLDNKQTPRLHDLRHNFACGCLEVWRNEGEDIQALLPVLANAMGHVNYYSTQIYVHTNGETLRSASERFASHFESESTI